MRRKKVEDKKEAPVYSFATQRTVSSINENVDVNSIYSSNEASNALLKEMDKQQEINIALKEESKKSKNELISGIAESTANFLISNALVSTLSAIGSKYGPLGSLGSITLGNHISNQIEKAID